jgi:hypothetical protein
MAAPGPHPRYVRRRIVLRWLQLLEDIEYLENAIEASPPESFPGEQRADALTALDQAHGVLLTERPALPRSRDRPPKSRGGNG